MKYKILLTLGLFISSYLSFGQNEVINHAKYWYYRNRLKKYFVKIGDCQGCSIPVAKRKENTIAWEQSSIMLGEYIGVLATEYLLLKNHGDNESAEATRSELNFALQAAIRKDIATDTWIMFSSCFPMNYGFDGFFLRDDVLETFDLTGLNQDLDPSTTIQIIASSNNKGIPVIATDVKSDYANTYNLISDPGNLESQDEAIGLLMGMALVVRCLPPYTQEYSLAQQIAYKMVKYMKDNGHYNTKLPCPINGDWRPQDGHNSLAYKFGLAASSNIIYPAGLLPQTNYSTWNNLVQIDIFGSDNRRMASTLAAISDSWTHFGVNSTGLSIRLLTWGKFGGFYIYLWKFLHNKSKDMTDFHGVNVTQNILNALNTAPCGGTYYYHNENSDPPIPQTSVTGWSSTDRLWTPQNHDGEDGYDGTFSGLDYMLMYNLYSLVNQLPVYYNMNDLKINDKYYPYLQSHAYVHYEPLFYIHCCGHDYPVGHHLVTDYYNTTEAYDNNPQVYKSFNTIETNAIIDTGVHISNYSASTNGTHLNGHVTMIAAKRIHLKPGFHAKKGSYFRASIQNVDVCSNNFKNSDTTLTQNDFTPIEYNDISPMPGYDMVHTEIDSLYKSFSQDDFSNTKEVFNISPNPGNGLFKIQSNSNIEDKVNVTIINEIGTIISQHNINSLPYIIDISNQPAGVYFITIITETDTYKLKYIKK